MTPAASAVLIGFFVVVGIAYDVIVYNLFGNDGTLSKGMQFIGIEWPILVVVWGGLGAHFFLPRDAYKHCDGWWCVVKPYAGLVVGAIVFRLWWPQSIVDY
jgi:hypothetical protein